MNSSKDSWIHDRLDWVPRPVIHLDFTQISVALDSEEGIRLELMVNAQAHGVELTEGTNAGRLVQLIRLLSREHPVAILVDEYDKPMIDHIDNLEALNQNRQILKNLYSVIMATTHTSPFSCSQGCPSSSAKCPFSATRTTCKTLRFERTICADAGVYPGRDHTLFPSHLASLKERNGQAH
ncbi:MAG: AAA family ATPase [Bacteroidia bacterium]